MPLPFYLRLEDSADRGVRAFLRSLDVGPLLNIEGGGSGDAFHVLATLPLLRELSELGEHHAQPEICMHLHVYSGRRILLQWYDAWSDQLLVDASVSEAGLQRFCEELQVEYVVWPYGW